MGKEGPTYVGFCWENSKTLFSKSPVSLTEGKVYIIFMYPPGLDSPSRLYYRQHAIYRHSEHVRQSGLSASVSVCG